LRTTLNTGVSESLCSVAVIVPILVGFPLDAQ